MKKVIFLILLLVGFSSCRSSKKAKNQKATTSKVVTKSPATKSIDSSSVKPAIKKVNESAKVNNIVKFAKQFKGVRYKWGGTSKSGMDCSGLVYESFRVHDIYLPRISRDMAKKGKKIKLKEAQEGDLLFFKTKNRRNAINHVGLVIKSNSKTLEFIHATSSKGVIITELSDIYWNKAFVEARRIL